MRNILRSCETEIDKYFTGILCCIHAFLPLNIPVSLFHKLFMSVILVFTWRNATSLHPLVTFNLFSYEK